MTQQRVPHRAAPDRRQRGCFLWEAAPKRIRQDGKKRTKRPGDAFHVLHGGGEEGLLVHVADSEHAGIAQAMQFFGFCEGSFNGFLAPGVDAFAFVCFSKRVRLLQCILPYMARHLPSAGFGREAFRPPGAVPACFGLAPVLPIAFPVGRAPCQLVPLRTQVNVFDWIIGETVFSEIVPLVRMPPIPYYRLYPGCRKLVTYRRVVVSRIQSHVLRLLPQPLINIL